MVSEVEVAEAHFNSNRWFVGDVDTEQEHLGLIQMVRHPQTPLHRQFSLDGFDPTLERSFPIFNELSALPRGHDGNALGGVVATVA